MLDQIALNLMPRIPLGSWVSHVVNWLEKHWATFFSGLASAITTVVEHLDNFLMSLPIVLVVIIAAVIALLARGPVMAVLGAVGFLLLDAFDEWPSSMETLSLVIVSAVIALVLAVPIGILAARSQIASQITRPVLDFMQTLPAFVYLLPVLFLFGIGYPPALIATIVFAMPAGVRLTELGIRQVDQEMVEAGQSFGASPGKILRGIQLPLAMPTIMAGVNQVIMLTLSMVVIGGLVGAEGLGGDVTSALENIRVGPGAEAGVCVVILAIYLDRVTAGLGGENESGVAKAKRMFQRQKLFQRQTTSVTAGT